MLQSKFKNEEITISVALRLDGNKELKEKQ
jgi:hypothetical protein